MTDLNRRELIGHLGLGATSIFVAPVFMNSIFAARELFADEPHVTVSPLNMITDEDGIELGKRFSAQLEKEQPPVSNALIDRYLSGLVVKLAAQSQRPNLPYAIKLMNSNIPGAYSLPGGFLYVYHGLIQSMSSECELAALLAHQIGHVAGRHADNVLLRFFTDRHTLKPLLDNLDKQNSVIEELILRFGGAVSILSSLSFKLKDEEQADLLGFYEMLRAGWNPNGFLKLFAHLDNLNKTSERTEGSFLSGHPIAPERTDLIRRELTEVRVPYSAITDSARYQQFKSAMGRLPIPSK
jgi:predicted Zn-dependent protease